jgi:hypothetical protein
MTQPTLPALTFDQDSELLHAVEALDRLTHKLTKATKVSDRYQIAQLLRAGRVIIGAPRPDRHLVDTLLVQPLDEILAQSLSVNIERDAKYVRQWLARALAKQK